MRHAVDIGNIVLHAPKIVKDVIETAQEIADASESGQWLCLSVCLFVCLSVCLSACLFVSLSVCLRLCYS
jgi:hypothetical protein